jgi:hypothetical protein
VQIILAEFNQYIQSPTIYYYLTINTLTTIINTITVTQIVKTINPFDTFGIFIMIKY